MTTYQSDESWSISETTVLERMTDALQSAEPAAVATVVSVDGSAYRHPGAKMLLTANGDSGSVTAGCLESDVSHIAAEVRASGQTRLERFDLTDDTEWGLGLGCNGIVDVFVEPLDERFVELLDRYQKGDDGLAVTVIESDRKTVAVGDREYTSNGKLPANQRFPDCLTDAVRNQAQDCFTRRQSKTTTVSAPSGGDVRVFFDTITAPPEIYVFGGGSDVQPVSELAKRTGFRVTVIPFRGGLAHEDVFPHADRVVPLSAPEIDSLSFDANTYAIVMSHNLVDDYLAVESLLATPVPYIGVMGPTERFTEIKELIERTEQTLTDADADRIYTPIGLDIGGGEPYQIAISIIAEVLSVHNRRDARHLRDRKEPIHNSE